MIGVLEVSQLVDEHIVDQRGRKKQETNVQRDVAAGGAAAPAGFLIAPGQPAVDKSMSLGQRAETRAQSIVGALFERCDQCRLGDAGLAFRQTDRQVAPGPAEKRSIGLHVPDRCSLSQRSQANLGRKRT